VSRAITRDAIVQTAAERLIADGLAGVTLRRIATELGVSAPTLYWHIGSKRELLDAVAERLLRSARTDVLDRPRPGQPWWDWLEERTRAFFWTMVRVRDAPLVVAGNRPTVESLGALDLALGELVAAGFPAAEAQQVFLVIGAYVGGMALEWQSEGARAEAGVDDRDLFEALEDFPYLAAAAADRRSPEATFDYGLALLIRGIRVRHAELVDSSA
jgi:TetR/AcrR family transcriptional regulator, tetracycline repressor protein